MISWMVEPNCKVAHLKDPVSLMLPGTGIGAHLAAVMRIFNEDIQFGEFKNSLGLAGGS